jgi:hypothetical protein
MARLCASHSHVTCLTDPVSKIPYVQIAGYRDDVGTDVLVALQHARELIAGEVALAAMERYALERPSRRTIVVPIINRCGVDRVWAGDHSMRKTCSGVDLNRQFTDVKGSSKCEHHYSTYGEEFEGPHAVSEAESKFLVWLMREHDVRTFLNVHSGEHSVYSPWDHDVRTKLPHEDGYAETLRTIRAHHECPECDEEGHLGQAYKRSSYGAWCTTGDYLVLNDMVKYAWTLEVYGRFDTRDDFLAFNPETAKQYEHVMNEWVGYEGVIETLLS